MELGMAAFKLTVEADRLIAWTKKFKPAQAHLTFPRQFGGQSIFKLLPKFATQNDSGHWFYQGYECRIAPELSAASIKPMPTAGTRDDPHRTRGENIAHLMRDGAR